MKLVMLMYLEEDDDCVERLLEETEVPVYSRLPLEGVGEGTEGWYGSVPAYNSRMIMTVVGEERAARLLDAVRECHDIADPRHPVRALQLEVEKGAACETMPNAES